MVEEEAGIDVVGEVHEKTQSPLGDDARLSDPRLDLVLLPRRQLVLVLDEHVRGIDGERLARGADEARFLRLPAVYELPSLRGVDRDVQRIPVAIDHPRDRRKVAVVQPVAIELLLLRPAPSEPGVARENLLETRLISLGAARRRGLRQVEGATSKDPGLHLGLGSLLGGLEQMKDPRRISVFEGPPFRRGPNQSIVEIGDR